MRDFARPRNPSSYVATARAVTPGGKSLWQNYITFYQVNPEPLAKVHAITGGSVSVRKWRGTNPNAQPCLEVRIYGNRARAVAAAMAPYLSKKRLRQLAPFFDKEAGNKTKSGYRHRILWIQPGQYGC